MKHHLVSMILIVAVIFALAFPVAIPAAAPGPQPQPSTSATAAVRHEEIHDAIASLRIARDYLQHATHDFGGHREEAVRKVDESLTQLQLCLGYDR